MSSEKTAHQLSVRIFVSFFISLLILLVVGEVLDKSFDLRDLTGIETSGWELRYIFYGVSVIVIIVIRQLKTFLITESKKQTSEECLRRMRVTGTLISSLCEIPALLGLVNLLTGGLRQDFHLLLGLSTLLLIMHFPRPAVFEECAKNLKTTIGWNDINPEGFTGR